VLTLLQNADRLAFGAAHRAHNPFFDRVLPPLTSSADRGGLWLAVAAALALSGRRRPAVRGLVSLGVASAVANGPVKLAARRSRPGLDEVPVLRRLSRQPTTSSFPSGHSASAAAFAVGVALEAPVLAVPVGVLAAGVAWGRVHTGVHYPGDVAAGLALGAASALAVTQVWPRRPDHPAAGRVSVEAPALPDGAGLVLVTNEAGGSADQIDAVEKTLGELLPRAELVRASDDLEEALRRAAERATVLGIMGGDGSVNCAAGVAHEKGLPLLVVPGGTLNHFAGELGLESVEDVIDAVRDGSAVRVSVGCAAPDTEDLRFLNTFALGVYPDLVRAREKREGRLGKWPAMALATAAVLRRAEPIRVEVDGEPRTLWTLFAGNGHYHPSGFAPSWRERMDDGCIDVRLVDATKPWSRTRMALALLTGRLGRSRVYEQRVVGRLEVRSRQGNLRIARDGEVSEGPDSLRLRSAADSLLVYRP
jgi:diacylglycerol kinase family enzyme/membrane-associated phospholipid phosphatase